MRLRILRSLRRYVEAESLDQPFNDRVMRHGLWVDVASGTGICASAVRPILGNGPATRVAVLMRFLLRFVNLEK